MEATELTALGFIGPYPHGEFYLYDEEYSKPIEVSKKVLVDKENWHWVRIKTLEDWCCIMCVYPPMDSDNWTASYNCGVVMIANTLIVVKSY